MYIEDVTASVRDSASPHLVELSHESVRLEWECCRIRALQEINSTS